MKINIIVTYLINFYTKCKNTIHEYLTKIQHEWHLLHVKHRAWRISKEVDTTMGDKLRRIASKIDAIEDYGNKYCNPDKVGRLDARHNKKYYNKLKNDIKKELLITLYNY